ncbi:MAG: SOS response-associated peptidase, partial [Sciscionella sp.]
SGVDHNVAPTKRVAVVAQVHPRDAEGRQDPDALRRELRAMRWGLVPHWAKDLSIGAKMINARAETAAEKPAFRTSLAKRRCLIPASGWYEWRRESGSKQPFYLTSTEQRSLALAGIFATWHDPASDRDAPPLFSCAVLTTDSVGALQTIHHRMPLVLAERDWAAWLDPDRAAPAELLEPPDEELLATLELRPVSDRVNNVRNNDAQLLARVRDPAVQEVAATDLDELALFEPGLPAEDGSGSA